MKWSNINLSKNVIILPGKTTKTKKSRIIPLLSILKSYLESITQECDYVVRYFGKKINRFKKSWLGISKDFPNTSLATILVSSGLPIRVAQEMLGHSSSKMTEHYSQLSDDYLTNFVGKLFNICPTDNLDIFGVQN